ncbi:alcohol dehydrogenase catalytic domain-containing protein [Microbacterium sp. RD1]|uniref:alcohol dehydrogenase catalytic domain-containing protein n=1 Tax=Microbacterium sp. RD1 TaxID=3457313 RepID=UPI003FA5308C
MKAVIQREAGDAATVAHVEDVADAPSPRTRDVQVRISVAPMHRGDLVGTQAPLGEGVPIRRLGTEGAGTVVAVGEAVHNLSVGDRVAVFPAAGTWSERVNVRAEFAVPIPDGVSDETASIVLVNTITSREVLRAVEEARAEAGAADDVPLIVSAAASAVGKLIVKQALDRHWPVVAVVRSERSARTVREVFPEVAVVITERDSWRADLRDAVGGRVPAITDAHGGTFVQEILPFLRDAGTLVVWGDLAAQPWTLTTSDLLVRELQIRAVSISRWTTRPEAVRIADQKVAVEIALQHPELLAVQHPAALDDLAEAVAATRANAAGMTLLRFGKE